MKKLTQMTLLSVEFIGMALMHMHIQAGKTPGEVFQAFIVRESDKYLAL